jgi:hypothetical protein
MAAHPDCLLEVCFKDGRLTNLRAGRSMARVLVTSLVAALVAFLAAIDAISTDELLRLLTALLKW